MAAASDMDYQTRVRNAQDADVPVLYINGFVNSITSGDIMLVLERNNKPVAVLNMSFTVAKTLNISLGQLVAQLEERVQRNMLTTHEVASALAGEDSK